MSSTVDYKETSYSANYLWVNSNDVNPQKRPTLVWNQPELHLDLRAQGELGSLIGRLAYEGWPQVVETHSDYIVTRVMIDIRDDEERLKADDVSTLYFERDGKGNSRIFSIWYDDMANLYGQPPTYRQWTMVETHGS